jgi:hypothetical protein
MLPEKRGNLASRALLQSEQAVPLSSTSERFASGLIPRQFCRQVIGEFARHQGAGLLT